MQNSITRYGFKRASEFRANPLNWRRHPARQRSALSESLERLGFIAPVIENERSGLLIDGHERVQQALDAGDEQVPYVAVSLSDEDERLALATFDPISAMAETDAEALTALVADIETNAPSLRDFLEDMSSAFISPDNMGDAFDGLPSDDRAGFQQMVFTLSDEQASFVKEALAKAKEAGPFIETGNENSNANALVRICEAYV